MSDAVTLSRRQCLGVLWRQGGSDGGGQSGVTAMEQSLVVLPRAALLPAGQGVHQA